MASQKHNILLVTAELVGLYKNGGIGTAYTNLARLLVRNGWEVTVLYTGSAYGRAGEAISRYLQDGILVRLLDDFSDNCNSLTFLEKGNPPFVVSSQKVLNAIQSLTSNSRFNLIEFAEFRGLGFRTCQAYRAGMLEGAGLITRLRSSTQWIREANETYLPYDSSSAVLDYHERYSFANATYKTSLSNYMLSWAEKTGWDVQDAVVVRNALPVVEKRRSGEKGNQQARDAREVVFFGRLEPRKGFLLFLDAIIQLDRRDIKYSFLGKNLYLDQLGITSADLIRRKLQGFDVSVIADLDRDEAIERLKSPGTLAVVPSTLEHFPNTVLECVVHGIPFIASRVGGIPEMLDWLQADGDHLFSPTAQDLAEKLRVATSGDLKDFVSELDSELSVELNRTICEQYIEFARPFCGPAQGSLAGKTNWPLVTVGVPYYNMGTYIRDTLDALEKQDYDNYEVLVVDDGSTEEMSRQAIDECRSRHPHFKFFHTPNKGLGAARNFLVSQAHGSIFIPVDADNLPLPQMVSRFSECMALRPSLTAASCFLGKFEDGLVPSMANLSQVFMPNGGPKFLALVENVLGDANSAFRTSWLKANRFSEDRAVGIHDWELLLRLINQEDAELDVIPEVLVYYRVRKGSMISTSSNILNYNLLAGTLSQITERTNWEDFHKTLLLVSLPAVHNAAVEQLHNSWSWRLTSPLRWGFNTIFRRGRK